MFKKIGDFYIDPSKVSSVYEGCYEGEAEILMGVYVICEGKTLLLRRISLEEVVKILGVSA